MDVLKINDDNDDDDDDDDGDDDDGDDGGDGGEDGDGGGGDGAIMVVMMMMMMIMIIGIYIVIYTYSEVDWPIFDSICMARNINISDNHHGLLRPTPLSLFVVNIYISRPHWLLSRGGLGAEGPRMLVGPSWPTSQRFW